MLRYAHPNAPGRLMIWRVDVATKEGLVDPTSRGAQAGLQEFGERVLPLMRTAKLAPQRAPRVRVE